MGSALGPAVAEMTSALPLPFAMLMPVPAVSAVDIVGSADVPPTTMPLPVPALVTLLTALLGALALIVTAPVLPEMLTLEPATMLVTPVFCSVHEPVLPLVESPTPDTPSDVTPELLNVTAPVLALTPMPVPATALVTPVFDKTHEPVVAVLAIPTPDTPSAVTPVLFTIGYAAEPESVIAVPPPTASTPEPELCVQ